MIISEAFLLLQYEIIVLFTTPQILLHRLSGDIVFSMKKATTIAQQIEILKKRNVEIIDEKKAKEILLDIGYYHLGYYFFPFEVTYPELNNRDHTMHVGTRFSDAVALYYFDFEIRNILSKYINRIEVAFRTYIIYYMSNKYPDNPCWFIDKEIVKESFTDSFDESCYKSIKLNPNIRRHHKKYKMDNYAPAWKTLEYMTLGNMLMLYKSLMNLTDKLDISRHFKVNQTTVFENYIETIRFIRNICAHGSVLYDTRLYHPVKNGPAGKVSSKETYSLSGAIKVISYLIGMVSSNRQHDLIVDLNKAYMSLKNKGEGLQKIVESATHMSWELVEISKLETYIK